MTNLSDLTARQLAVASLVGKGWTVKAIAHELGIGERRVRVHISSIAYRIGADATKDEQVQVALWWQVQTAIAA